MKTSICYGPYHLTGGKSRVSSTNERSHPTQLIQREKIARQDGAIKVADLYDEKRIQIKGKLLLPSEDSVNTFRDIENEFDNALSKKNRILRFTRKWITINDVDSDTGWSGGGDTVNITTDTYNYMVSNQSLNFDIDVSYTGNDYAEVYNSSLTSVDLSDQEETGNIEFWLFIEDNNDISNIDVRMGSDSSNYWGASSVGSNYEGNSLETGWNLISVDWSGMSSTGSPDSSDLTYFYLKINYTEDQEDSQNNKISGIRWVDEDKVTNYVCNSVSVQKPEVSSNITYLPYSATILALKGLALATHRTQLLDRNSQTSATKEVEVRILGSYRPKPRIVYTLNSTSGLDSVTFRHINTNEEMTVSTAWTVNDILSIDTDELQCTLNGIDVEYDGVFPRHIVGLNRLSSSFEASGANEESNETFTDYVTSTSQSDSTSAIAQSFTAPADGFVTEIQLYGYYSGDELGQSVSVWTDSGGEPGTRIAGTGSRGTNVEFSTSPAWTTIAIGNDDTGITNGNTYWIVFEQTWEQIYSAGGGITNKSYIAYDADEGYAGDMKTSATAGDDDGVWQAYAGDMAFKITITPALTSLNYDWDVYYKKRYV